MIVRATIELEFADCEFDLEDLRSEIGFGAQTAVMDVTATHRVDGKTTIEIIKRAAP